jgi:hypothetical protein
MLYVWSLQKKCSPENTATNWYQNLNGNIFK